MLAVAEILKAWAPWTFSSHPWPEQVCKLPEPMQYKLQLSLWLRLSVQATKKGITEQFAASQAQAFAAANQDKNVAAYAVAVAEAIQKGGESATKAHSGAASGGEQAAGLAHAIAVVHAKSEASAEP